MSARRAILLLGASLAALSCARRVVLDPSRALELNDRQWRISSVPHDGKAKAADPAP